MLTPGECAATVRGAPPSHWFCAGLQELNEKSDAIARLTEQLDVAQSDNNRLLAEMEAVKQQLLETQSELADTRDSGQALRNQLESQNRELAETVARLRQQSQAMEAQLTAVSTERDDGLARLSSATTQLEGQKADQEKTRQAFDKERALLEQRLAALQEQLDNERAESQRLQLASQVEQARLNSQLTDAVRSNQSMENGLKLCKEETATAVTYRQQLSEQVALYRQWLGDADQDGVVDPLDLCPDTAGNQEVDETGCSGNQEISLQGVTFDFDSAQLSQESLRALEAVAAKLKNHPALLFEIAGHTDNTGNTELNLLISAKRAKSVKDYLVANGVPEERLSTRGYGPERPIADNATAAGRALNRRVSLIRRVTTP
jgi:outer membrane protein OmpA-like peptidoglycan-associated protein